MKAWFLIVLLVMTAFIVGCSSSTKVEQSATIDAQEREFSNGVNSQEKLEGEISSDSYADAEFDTYDQELKDY